MSWRDQEPADQRWQVSPRNPDGSRRRPPIRLRAFLTPTRVTLVVALVGSLLFLLYAITVRDPSQIPLLASGLAVLGIVFAALALAGAIGTYRAGLEGRGGRALVLAVLGGIAAVIAFGCFSAAVILALTVKP